MPHSRELATPGITGHVCRMLGSQSIPTVARLALAAASTALPPAFAQGTSPDPTSGYSSSAEVGVGSGFSSDVERNGAVVGESRSLNFFASYTIKVSTGTPVNWQAGLAVESFYFSPTAGVLIPDAVGSVTLDLGVDWQISDRWNLAFSVKPGTYNDFKDLDLDDFNAPVLAFLTYRWSDRLTLGGAVSVNGRNSSLPVIGGVGLRWQMSDRWTLALLFPKPRVEFAPNDRWRLWLGGEWKNGAFHVAEDFGTQLGVPQLNSGFLEYREIRGGIGAERRFANGLRLSADVGWLLNRQWNFERANVTYDGNGAAYGQLMLNYKF